MDKSQHQRAARLLSGRVAQAVEVPFRIGTASSSAQIEGSMPPSNWTRWAAEGNVVDGTSPNPTSDHWVRWREDNELMSNLGLQIARVSVEWARIEPQPGRFDREALERYAAEYRDLKQRNISPLVTLHHFSHPLWFENLGAFTREENVAFFLRFVNEVLDALGDIVDDWITINEPNVYATQAYLFNESPPGGKPNWKALQRTLRNLALAHIKTYELIHARLDSNSRDIKVSFAHHVRAFAPRRPKNPIHRAVTVINETLFHRMVEEAFISGRFAAYLGKPRATVAQGRYVDAIAVNYYSRTAVTGFADGVFPAVAVNDLGWEIYPQGLVEQVTRLHRQYQLPVWITENGTAETGPDSTEKFRCRFILDHLTLLAEAAASGVEVTRYYHWCFVDNWEWSEGMAARFGIVALDPETLDRHVKPSGEMIREIISQGRITLDLWDRYAEAEGYPRGIELSQPGAHRKNAT